MNNEEVRDILRKKAEVLSPPASLQPEQIEKKLAGHTQKQLIFPRYMRPVIATAACLVCIYALVLGLPSVLSRYDLDDTDPDGTAVVVENTEPAIDLEKTDTTYEDICDAINKYNEKLFQQRENTNYGSSGIMDIFRSDTTGGSEPTNELTGGSSSSENASSSDSSGSNDYSDTDTQVAGVMEGDIVKTDGHHIYTMLEESQGYTVSIYRADGASVEYLSQIRISQADCREIYIDGTSLIMLGDLWEEDVPSMDETDFEAYYAPRRKSHITLYDISDPSNPKAVRQLSQSGYYNTSRIYNGYLYTYTNYAIVSYDQYKEDEPDQYVPKINGETMPSEQIRLLNKTGANSYMVMTSLNISDSTGFADSQAILGEFDTYYMNQNHIYAVNQNTWDYDSIRSTIVKYSYDNGRFAFQGSTQIRGEINDSYYMHEYNDYFVFVYTHESKNYVTNGLCVMDENLKQMGEISNLGVRETIYASYFVGHMAYFVTYRNTDPVFAVDIRDPENPVLKSELKLPGFSSYLHSFGDNQLIGIGAGNKSTDSDDLGSDRVKLSLFSIGEDYEIEETDQKLAAQFTDSYAGENHKAVFIDEERGLVGLGIENYDSPGKSAYVVYQCQKGKLKKVLSVSFASDSSVYYVRGLRIGEYFYVVNTMGEIEVYDINTWKEAK